MNLQENYKRLFKGRIGSNDSKLISEAKYKVEVISTISRGMDTAEEKMFSGVMTAANLQDLKQQLVDEYSDGMFDIEDVIEDSGEGSFDIMLGLGEEMLANVKIL